MRRAYCRTLERIDVETQPVFQSSSYKITQANSMLYKHGIAIKIKYLTYLQFFFIM